MPSIQTLQIAKWKCQNMDGQSAVVGTKWKMVQNRYIIGKGKARSETSLSQLSDAQ